MTSVVISLDDLRQELSRFFLEDCRKELKELSQNVRNDVHTELTELRGLMGDYQQPAPRRNSVASAGTRGSGHSCSNDSGVAMTAPWSTQGHTNTLLSAGGHPSYSMGTSRQVYPQGHLKDLLKSVSFNRSGNKKKGKFRKRAIYEDDEERGDVRHADTDPSDLDLRHSASEPLSNYMLHGDRSRKRSFDAGGSGSEVLVPIPHSMDLLREEDEASESSDVGDVSELTSSITLVAPRPPSSSPAELPSRGDSLYDPKGSGEPHMPGAVQDFLVAEDDSTMVDIGRTKENHARPAERHGSTGFAHCGSMDSRFSKEDCGHNDSGTASMTLRPHPVRRSQTELDLLHHDVEELKLASESLTHGEAESSLKRDLGSSGEAPFSMSATSSEIAGMSTLMRNARVTVNSAAFDYLFGLILILNAFFMGAETNVMATHGTTSGTLLFRIFNALFCVAFTIELACRVAAYRSGLFFGPGWQWGWFDSMIVGIQIVDEMTLLFLDGTAVQKTIEDLGIFRILRLFRIVRLVRMIRLIPELKSMVYLISASMWSFIWAMLLIVLLMYCVAVYYTDTANKIAQDSEPYEADQIRKYYGDVGTSMLSLFQAITGGDDWRNFIDVFQHDTQFTACAFIFAVYVSFAMLVMLNLVTGVFVQGAQRIVKQEEDAELNRIVCKAFGSVDDDNSMNVSFQEFMSHLNDGFLDQYFSALDLSKSQAATLFMLLDVDNSGTLNVDEFVRGCMRLRGPARSIDLAALACDFKTITDRLQDDNYTLAGLISGKTNQADRSKHGSAGIVMKAESTY